MSSDGFNHEVTANLSANIRREMLRLGVSNAELSRRAGFHAMTVNDCVHGRKVPGAPLVIAIARALGVTVDRLAEPAQRARKARKKSA